MKTLFYHPKTVLWISIFVFWIGNSISSDTVALARTGAIKNSQQVDNVIFAVIGDYGSGESQEADVANLVKSWNPDFIVTVGDNNYPIGAAYAIDDNIGQFYHDYIYPYNGKYGAGAAYKRFFPVLGNHDWMSNGAVPYFDYFSFYNHKGYYDFVYGPIHFFMLDSDPNEPDGNTSTSKQAKWLKNGLAASTSSFNIVVLHHAPYSSGLHGSTTATQWPYKAWGADAVISGHDHLYERVLVDGFPYFVDGIGGEDIYSIGTIVLGSQIRFNQDFGAMRVEANSTSMKFQAITRAGQVVDEYTISNAVPIVNSISSTISNPSNASNIDYTVNFSEPVSGVDGSDFSLNTNINNASISNVTGSGNTYTVSVNTGMSDGSLRLDLIDNDSIMNVNGKPLGDTGTGNGNFTAGQTYVIDKTPPVVTSITRTSPNPSNTPSVDFTVTFSEPVSGVDPTDFSLSTPINGALIGAISGSGNIYTVSVNIPPSEGTLRLDLIDNDSIVDAAGNKLGGIGNTNFTIGEAYIIDQIPPAVTSIVRASPNPSSSSTIDFIVTFSESVSGVDSSDFNLTSNNINNASILSVANSDPFYVVTVNTGVGAGTLQLNLTDDDTISDKTGNKLGGLGAGNGSFVSGDEYQIDKTIPAVVSIAHANPDPNSLATVDFVVAFSGNVTGVDVTDFTLTTNIPDASISNVAGSGNTFTVSVNTGSSNGNLQLNLIDNDSILNDEGIPLGSTGLGNGNFTTGEAYTIYKSFPRVTSIIRASTNPSGAGSVDFIVTFSESVSGVDASDFSITSNGIVNSSIISIGSFDPFYVVTVNTGIGTGSLRLDFIDNDSISDSAGNKPGGSGIENGNFTDGESYTISKASINFPPPAIRGSRRDLLTNNPSPTFGWATVRGAQSYEIMIASDSNFTQLITSQVLNALTYTINPGLGDGIYYWHVRAYNGNLQPGRFSYTQSFTIDTTPPSLPTLINPANNANVSIKPLFTWSKVDSAISYQIEVDNDADFSSPELTSTRNDASYQVARMAKGTFYWRVQAKDMAGNWGNWSVPFAFKIP